MCYTKNSGQPSVIITISNKILCLDKYKYIGFKDYFNTISTRYKAADQNVLGEVMLHVL